MIATRESPGTASLHPGGLAAAGGDPDRLRPADAALLAVLLYSWRATSRYTGPGLMSKAARSRRGFRVENLRHVGWQLFRAET